MIRYKDTIRTIVRSTGSSSDGHSPEITLPDKDSQAKPICDIYQKADLDMQMTTFS